MSRINFVLAVALALTVPNAMRAQENVDFSGTWKLSKAQPAGYKGAKGDFAMDPGPGAGWAATSQTIVVKQNANVIRITSTSFGDNEERTFTYTLDNKEKVMDDPKHPGIAGWRWMTKARWEGSTLVVFTYQGWNQIRDKYTLNAGQLTISREFDGQTGGTTSVTGPQTLVYTK
jgi:hypothetical protein